MVIYVGATKCLKSRLNTNSKLRPYYNVWYTPIMYDRFKLESKLIKLLNPVKNSKTGRRALPAGKKVVPITIYVLTANQGAARAECARIASKYR